MVLLFGRFLFTSTHRVVPVDCLGWWTEEDQGNVCKVCIHSQVVVDIVCGISIDRCLIELSGWMAVGIHDRPSS